MAKKKKLSIDEVAAKLAAIAEKSLSRWQRSRRENLAPPAKLAPNLQGVLALGATG